MVTPCLHRFHPRCLMDWMDKRLNCPMCRATLPPSEQQRDDSYCCWSNIILCIIQDVVWIIRGWGDGIVFTLYCSEGCWWRLPLLISTNCWLPHCQCLKLCCPVLPHDWVLLKLRCYLLWLHLWLLPLGCSALRQNSRCRSLYFVCPGRH